MQDTTADMLTRIRNGLSARHKEVIVYYSKFNLALSELLVREGYVTRVKELAGSGKKNLVITLKYFRGNQVIDMIKRVSRPSKRVYSSAKDLPLVYRGLGISVISTSLGIMTDREARARNIGGEVICQVV